MSLLINASPSLHCLASTVRNHEISGPASDHCPAAINSPACLRVLPVCQHRSVRYALDIPTYAIKKMSVAAVELSYVPGTTYSTQEHETERRIISTMQQTADYSHIGSRSLILFSFLLSSDTMCSISLHRHPSQKPRQKKKKNSKKTKTKMFVCVYSCLLRFVAVTIAPRRRGRGVGGVLREGGRE